MQRRSSSKMASKQSEVGLSNIAFLYQRSPCPTLSLLLDVAHSKNEPHCNAFSSHPTYVVLDTSLEAIYIPPTVTVINQYAFSNCKSLRIINIQDTIHQLIGYNILYRCENLNTDEVKHFTTQQENRQWIRNRYNHLHNLCWDPSVNAENVQQYIQTHHHDEERAATNDIPQFTPLHLLAVNPSITGDMITAYLRLAPDVDTMQDNKAKTPLHMLCSVPSYVDGTGSATEPYLGGCMEGKKAAFMADDEGRTSLEVFNLTFYYSIVISMLWV